MSACHEYDCCQQGTCCLDADESLALHSTERALLLHFGKHATLGADPTPSSPDDEAERDIIPRERRRLLLPETDRERAVASWGADERVYGHHNLPEPLIAEGMHLQHAICGTFLVAAYETQGAVLVRIASDSKKLQVFRVRSLHGRCLRQTFAGQTGAQLQTVLYPWQGWAVCCGYACAGEGEGYTLRLPLKAKLPLLQAYHAAVRAESVLGTLIPRSRRDKYAAELKARGNAFFKKGGLPAALKEYRAGIRVCATPDLHSNAALMCLKQHLPGAALDHCHAGLRLDPSHAKLGYRKVQALHALGLTPDTRRAARMFAAAHPAAVKEAAELAQLAPPEEGAEPAAAAAAHPQPRWKTLLLRDVAECVAAHLTLAELDAVCRVSQHARAAFRACLRSVTLSNKVVCLDAAPIDRLTTLTLSGCRGVCDKSVQVILARCRGLESLSLRDCPLLTGRAVHDILLHVRLQQPAKAVLPGMPRSQASLDGLPPLRGMTGVAAPSPAPEAVVGAAPASGRRRRPRHREVMFNAPADGVASAGVGGVLSAVDLSRCDAVPPSEEMEALALAVELRSTCLPSDFIFSAASPQMWVVASAHDDPTSGQADADGRLLYHHGEALKAAGFSESPVGAFALTTDLPREQACDALLKLGLTENALLTSLVR